MKEKEKSIQEEIDKTMASLDHLNPVEGNPFLFTRIEERLEYLEPVRTARIPRWQLSLAGVLIVINSIAILNTYFSRMERNRAALLEDIAQEYGIDNTGRSDFEFFDLYSE